VSGKENKIEDTVSARVKKNRRIVLILISVFLAAVLIFGAVIGTASLVRHSRAVIKYNGVLIDGGVASYLAATYKNAFMTMLGTAYDTEEFWSQNVPAEDCTYGEILEKRTSEYIRRVAVGSYLFDRYTKLSKDESDRIERALKDVLDFQADNDRAKFNRECAAMGFDYDDFCEATRLIYKYEQVKSVIYGQDGSRLAGESMYAECNIYFEQYSHVKILYIPTREEIVRGENGELETDENGKYVTRYFTAEETIERKADIAEIRELIDGLRNNGPRQMSPEYFEHMQGKYNYDSTYNKTGHYFSKMSTYTSKFAEASSVRLPDEYSRAFYKYMKSVTEDSLSMGEGEYKEIEGDYGICFIYKYAREDYAYLLPSLTVFFSDFYSDAANYLFNKTMEELACDVIVKDDYYRINITAIPYNYIYIAKVE
jgi:hypothetical protein